MQTKKVLNMKMKQRVVTLSVLYVPSVCCCGKAIYVLEYKVTVLSW